MAAALLADAAEHRVTEMVLARREESRARRYPLLRELAARARGVEPHVLPAEAGG